MALPCYLTSQHYGVTVGSARVIAVLRVSRALPATATSDARAHADTSVNFGACPLCHLPASVTGARPGPWLAIRRATSQRAVTVGAARNTAARGRRARAARHLFRRPPSASTAADRYCRRRIISRRRLDRYRSPRYHRERSRQRSPRRRGGTRVFAGHARRNAVAPRSLQRRKWPPMPKS